MSDQEPSEDELRAALEDQMRNIRVEDVILQTAVTLINLAARRLGLTSAEGDGEERDLEQARLGIDGARALLPLVPGEQGQQLREPISQLQMAYAREAAGSGAPAPAGQPTPAGEEQHRQAADQQDAEAERAKARSKIWTPPGA